MAIERRDQIPTNRDPSGQPRFDETCLSYRPPLLRQGRSFSLPAGQRRSLPTGSAWSSKLQRGAEPTRPRPALLLVQRFGLTLANRRHRARRSPRRGLSAARYLTSGAKRFALTGGNVTGNAGTCRDR